MLTNMKKRTALLTSLAVLCATVALVPSTASAQGSKVPNAGVATAALNDPHTAPTNDSPMSACPGNSAPAAGFTDTTSTDVDCIKMFGITQGTTATTYEPAASIPRWQMALFLHRMFVPTGLAAAGTTTVPAFTDTSGLSAEIQAAITAIASHGITVGTSATTFGPDDNVTREQMAIFLYRFGQKIKGINVAGADARGIFANAIDDDTGTGDYNFTDIAGTTFEGMEAIIAMYNLGATAETCTSASITAAAGSGCQTTYRPSEDLTRAEMATMIKAVLDPSQARPAGVTIQATTAVTATGEATLISARNADFTPNSNVIADAFWYIVNDTSAATQALSAPYGALDGLCSSSQVTGTSTRCTLDSGDAVTNALGNAAGPTVTFTAPSTGHVIAWTADQGTFWINGTSSGFEFTASVAAAAAGSTFATTATSAINKAAQSNTCNFSALDNIAAADGECAYQGTSRTITTTLTGASTAAVVDGYTVKYTDKVVNYGGGSGNDTVSFNITYVPTSSGVASLQVTCSADPLPLTNNAADDGAPDVLDYYESHEVTVAFGTAAGGTGLPASASTPGTITGNTDISCDDVARDYVGAGIGSESLTVNQNFAVTSTAGTLASITATATDQYGDGIAGVEARFAKTIEKNVAFTAKEDVAASNQATLFTGADGTATFSTIVCDSASVGHSGVVKWSIADPGNNANEMDNVGVGNGPGATVDEGQWIHCVKTAADAVGLTTIRANVTGVTHVVDIEFYVANGTTACDPDAGTYVITYNGEAADALGHDQTDNAANSAAILAALHANDNIVADGLQSAAWAANTGTTGGEVTNSKITLTFKALSGNHTGLVSVAATGLRDGADEVANQCATANIKYDVTTPGVHQTTYDFVDHNAASKQIIAMRTVQDRVSATGANVLTKDYEIFTYDDGDVFNLSHSNPALATPGATLAQFEAGMNAVSTLTQNLSVTYRTAATGTQVSAFDLTIG
jgi:hypothetical protein